MRNTAATQQFHRGDLVRVAKDLGPHMSHFTADCDAVVLYSYADKYGGSDRESYSLHLKGKGSCSWYEGHQLTLIESGRMDLLEQWEAEEEAERKQKSDLDWIFAHGSEVLEKPNGASVQALAECMGITNLWGNRGEGIAYLFNMLTVLRRAAPYLESGNKEGWLANCAALRKAA